MLDRIYAPPKAPLTPDLRNWESHSLAAVWIGHATVLLRIDDVTILTDPVFSNRVGIGLGLMTGGPKRHYRPAVSIKELPPIDIILLSHAHFDHLDRPTLVRLPKKSRVICALGIRDLVEDLGYRDITELDWEESSAHLGLKISAQPVKHWGARTFLDSHRGFCSYLIESKSHRMLYGADTAYHEEWKSLAPVDLAILGIGAYDPYIAAHASPEQALAMADHLKARYILPIHHSTFKLSHEPMHEPIERMLKASSDQNRIVVTQVGGLFSNG